MIFLYQHNMVECIKDPALYGYWVRSIDLTTSKTAHFNSAVKAYEYIFEWLKQYPSDMFEDMTTKPYKQYTLIQFAVSIRIGDIRVC